MGILRILAWVLIGLCIALIGADGVSSLEEGAPVIRSAAEVISLFGLELGSAEVGGALGVLLGTPLWALLGGLGVVLLLVLRPVD